MEISNFMRLKYAVNAECVDLSLVSDYLSEEGKARLEALRAVYWYCNFCETLEELSELDDFKDLINIPGKHLGYYKALREVNRDLEAKLSESNL